MKFYTIEWIDEVFKRYQTEESSFFIEDKEINFKPKHFLWALLHIYHNKELSFLGDLLNIEDLRSVLQNQVFDFMYLVDLLRKEFAYWFKENILYRDFSEETYFTLAHEFLLLEEKLKEVEEVNGVKLLVTSFQAENMGELREMGDYFKNKLGSGIIFLIGEKEQGNPLAVCMVTKDLAEKYPANRIFQKLGESIGLKGGGKAELSQGGFKEKVSSEKIKTILKKELLSF